MTNEWEKKIPQCLRMSAVYSSHTSEVTSVVVEREEYPEHACQISHVRFDNLEKAIAHYGV